MSGRTTLILSFIFMLMFGGQAASWAAKEPPACPSGSVLQHHLTSPQKWGVISFSEWYQCRLPMEGTTVLGHTCYEWKGTGWNPAVRLPCGLSGAKDIVSQPWEPSAAWKLLISKCSWIDKCEITTKEATAAFENLSKKERKDWLDGVGLHFMAYGGVQPNRRCTSVDFRSPSDKEADPVCIQKRNDEAERKQQEQAEQERKAEREKKYQAAIQGIHIGQSQETVKAILQARGFSPWICEGATNREGDWDADCLASKGRLRVAFFFNIYQRIVYLDPDTQLRYVTKKNIDKLYSIANLSPEEPEEPRGPYPYGATSQHSPDDSASQAGFSNANSGPDQHTARGPYAVGGDVSPPVVISKSEPIYTERAKDAKIQGTVTLWVVIDAQGNVTDVQVDKSLDKGLDQNAVTTVKTWKFKPAMRNGTPVPVKVMVAVSFRLF